MPESLPNLCHFWRPFLEICLFPVCLWAIATDLGSSRETSGSCGEMHAQLARSLIPSGPLPETQVTAEEGAQHHTVPGLHPTMLSCKAGLSNQTKDKSVLDILLGKDPENYWIHPSDCGSPLHQPKATNVCSSYTGSHI